MASDPALVDVQAIERAGVVIACRDFASNLTFFTDSLGFRVETIHPADGPTHASIIGHGCRLYLDCLLYTSPSPRDRTRSRMPSSA